MLFIILFTRVICADHEDVDIVLLLLFLSAIYIYIYIYKGSIVIYYEFLIWALCHGSNIGKGFREEIKLQTW
jgi:hypothetical protein